MAKINHHNFVNTINDILAEAKKRGVLQLESHGDEWMGDTVQIDNREFVNFGTCGYMGLETHPKVIAETLDYTKRFGVQFSVSRTYLVSKQNYILEEYLSQIFSNKPVIAFTSTTMAHLSVLPIVVGFNDAIILDQQAHISIQTAAQLMSPKGVPIDIIRHNSMDMLEHKLKAIYDKYDKIWYMIDGVYSMYGDVAPIDEINELMEKYPKLYLYVDDAHGMSWYGTNGSGRLFEKTIQNKKTMYITTLAKGYGTMGGIGVFPEKSWYDRLILHGGPLAYSHPLPPPMMGAAMGAAKIHLSPEIYEIQKSLKEKLEYANELFDQSNVPILSSPETPIFFVGTGQPIVGYNLNKRIIDEGFYVNIGMFPAVPVKNTGLRFTITNHNSKEQIKSFIDAICYHYPKVMEEEGKTINDVRKAFRLPLLEEVSIKKESEELIVKTTNTIREIDKEEWNKMFSDKGNFDWNALCLMEEAFSENELKEENWKFHYILIYDKSGAILLATFFTGGLFKDDLLSSAEVSKQIEEKRKTDKYYLCSETLTMGSLLTEGDHLYVDKTNVNWKKSVKVMLQHASIIQDEGDFNSMILRDFNTDETELGEIFHQEGFFKVQMPNSNVADIRHWETEEEFVNSLSARNRKNINQEVYRYSSKFICKIVDDIDDFMVNEFSSLYKNVGNNNLAINMFSYPKKLLKLISRDSNWETMALHETDSNKLVAICFCYKGKNVYCPIYLGMDYNYSNKLKVYKQLLFRLMMRSKELEKGIVRLGMSADTDKRKIGANQINKNAFFTIKDSYSNDVLSKIEIK